MEKLYYLMISKNPQNYWFQVLVIMTILFVFVFLYKTWAKEGFVTIQLDKVYSFKDDIYDDVYAELCDLIYKNSDDLVDTIVRIRGVADEANLIKSEGLPKDFAKNASMSSVFLDVDFRNGQMMMALKKRGYTQVYGIHKHAAMVRHLDDSDSVCADVLDVMNFERATFTHILCLNHSLYEIADLPTFFENCHFWLKPGGTLVLHLAEYTSSKTVLTPNIEYVRRVDLSGDQSVIIHETFTDTQMISSATSSFLAIPSSPLETSGFLQTQHVRQQERRVQYQDKNAILNLAADCGFHIQGEMRMGEMIYFLSAA